MLLSVDTGLVGLGTEMRENVVGQQHPASDVLPLSDPHTLRLLPLPGQNLRQ